MDLPANHSHIANPASLTLPDVLTELDLLAPMPDPSLLLGDPLTEFDSSQRLLSTMDRSRANSLEAPGLDDSTFDQEFATPRSRRERDIELGRDAPLSMSRLEPEDTLRPGEGEDLELDFGEPEPAPAVDTSVLPGLADNDGELPPLLDDDITMGGIDTGLDALDAPPIDEQHQHDSQSPLSSVRSSVERELERTVNGSGDKSALFQPDEEEMDETIQQAQRTKRRKVIQPDYNTELQTAQIRAQQQDRSKILQPVSFLPKDPVLLALMEMQRKGGFASSLLSNDMSKGWAPQLRGILSLEVVRQAGQKRRRDGTVAQRSPELEEPRIEFDADDALGVPPAGDLTTGADPTGAAEQQEEQVDADHASPREEDDDGLAMNGEGGDLPDQTFGFDQTEAPLLHPNETGPVSLGTKHAVHLLREQFGTDAEGDASQRQKSSLLFQDLLPEKTTTRADATKMFFEILVLATKDAVKVEQPSDELGGPLRVRARRGLWGSWAETEVEKERGEQEAGQQGPVQATPA